MRISVNLATKPFVELRPFFLRLRVLMAALAVLAVGLLIAAHMLQGRLDKAQAQMEQLKARTRVAQQEKQTNEKRMRQPANAEVLDRAHFLNALFLRKSFSWTAVMMDLETVLPGGVQVTSIEPGIAADGTVLIRLRVSGDRDRAVQLVRNLERSKRFLEPRLMAEAVQAKQTGQTGTGTAAAGTPGGVEFEILADYNPLPEGEAYPKERKVDAAAPSIGPRAGAAPRAPGLSSPKAGVVLKPFRPGAPKGGGR
jgi:type IV pilus assembly protein PilN